MLVLVDIEWIERVKQKKKYQYLTQLSALRVGEDWTPLDTYNALICPDEVDDAEWEHMAFNGYAPMDFYMNGLKEDTCITEFSQWLQEDDVICVWHYDSKHMLNLLWEKVYARPPYNHITRTNKLVYRLLKNQGHICKGIYKIAKTVYEIETPPQEHCAKNDVSVLRSILCCAGIDQSALIPKEETEITLPVDTEEKQKALAALQHNYVYSMGSSVFHTKTCRYIQHAEHLIGCKTFTAAAYSRRPCRVCNPTNPATIQPNGKTKTNPETWLNKRSPKGYDDLISVRLITGERVSIAVKKIVGQCNYHIHPGKLTKQLLEEHNCIGKGCPYLKPYGNSPYWTDRVIQRNIKENVKAKKKTRKAWQRAKADHLDTVRKEFQEYILHTDSKMEITSVVREREGVYKIFYVSDNQFPDWDQFPEFLALIKLHHPKWRINLRRVRDSNGKFVTIEQFHIRQKNI